LIKSDTFTIGLTGGIASGKTAVSDLFKKHGVEVIDADIVARQVVMPNTLGLNKLIKEFGEKILSQEQQLDRAILRKIVFNNKNKLKILNQILHPIIQHEIREKVGSIVGKYCIIVIPLLCPGHQYNWLDRILVVDVKVETQMQRLTYRDSISSELAEKMISSQCSRKQRLFIADDVINNEGSKDKLQMRVSALNEMYKSIYQSLHNDMM
jgi:dephospho-CoA kinase